MLHLFMITMFISYCETKNSAHSLLLRYILPPPPCNPFPAPHLLLNLLPEHENSLACIQNNIMFLF